MSWLPATRRGWLLLAMPVVAALVCLSSAMQYVGAFAAEGSIGTMAASTVRDVAELERLTGQAPVVAAVEASPGEIAERIAAARREIGLPEAVLREVQPSPAVRIGTSDYLQRSTRLDLRGVTLAELAAFVAAVEDESASLVASAVHLTTPRRRVVAAAEPAGPSASNGGGPAIAADSPDAERWNAELTLTQTIVSPIVADERP